jgi:hypothetical protein
MDEMKEVKLASGNTLKIGVVPFEQAKGLYQTILDEMKLVKLNPQDSRVSLFKDLFCMGFSSKRVEASLVECFKRCHYVDKRGELKIDKDTFEPVEARGDYIEVCIAVTTEVVGPFSKGLYAAFTTLFEKADNVLQ